MASVIDRAKTQLIVNHPFFASILLKRKMIATDQITTMAMRTDGTVLYNPEFTENLSVANVVFGLAHECMHYMLLHCGTVRRGARDPQGWNIAADAVINETLIASGVGEFIEGGVRWAGAEDMTTEQVYELLPESEKDGSGKGPGGLGSDVEAEGSGDPAKEAEREAEVKVEMAEAVEAARQMGKLPAHIKRMVETLLDDKTPWHQYLADWMTQRAKNDYSWSRPNRRFVHQGLYLPSLDGVSLGEIAVVIDTSGSVGPKELAEFGGHLNNILETCNPTAVHVVYCDAEVNRVDEVSPEDLPVRLEPVGGGGTDMRVGLQWVEENVVDPSCVVLLTDGYTPWPEQTTFPLFVATTAAESPIGTCVKLEV